MPTYIVQFMAMLLLALVTGVFWGPWFSLHRSMHKFSAAEFLGIAQTMIQNLSIPMRVLMPACILFMGLSVWFYPERNSAGFYFNIASLALSVVALLITVMIEVPIVNQIRNWNLSTIPANWKALRNRWTFFHAMRTFTSIGSFASLVVALLLLTRRC